MIQSTINQLISGFGGTTNKIIKQKDDIQEDTVSKPSTKQTQKTDIPAITPKPNVTPEEVLQDMAKRGQQQIQQKRNFYNFRDSLGRFARRTDTNKEEETKQ